ncbi:MAG: transcription elongation factor GreAB [Xanthomonadaceae bacterium]|mgnify:FL=1|nr:transcription elongation factor GreAB [Xanthomonadaceae bacterium]
MSKAFVKEDDAQDVPLVVPARPPLPPGTPNYVTPRGLRLLQEERERLARQRDALDELADEGERRRRHAVLAQQLAELDARLASAVVVDPAGQDPEVVRFGATVTVSTEAGEERRYRIVGVDEANAAEGRVSFLAPVARALLGRSLDDEVRLETANGVEVLEIIAIDYEQE